MNEREPTFEHGEVTEEQVIEALKSRGPQDIETAHLHRRWIDQEWKKLPKDPIEMIRFNQRRARLYRAAGYLDEAFEMLWDAREQLLQEPRQNTRAPLYQELTAEIEELDRKE